MNAENKIEALEMDIQYMEKEIRILEETIIKLKQVSLSDLVKAIEKSIGLPL